MLEAKIDQRFRSIDDQSRPIGNLKKAFEFPLNMKVNLIISVLTDF